MEYTKEEIFNIQYNNKKDRLEIKKKNKLKNEIINLIKNNKLLTTSIITFFIFCCLNFLLIYQFMQIMQMM